MRERSVRKMSAALGVARRVLAAVLRAARPHRRTIEGLSQPAAAALFASAWPGTLRELDRVVHAAVALTESEVIDEGAILLPGLGEAYARPAPALPPVPGADQSLRALERDHVRRVLAAFGGNKARTARALGVSRSTLERKLVASK